MRACHISMKCNLSFRASMMNALRTTRGDIFTKPLILQMLTETLIVSISAIYLSDSNKKTEYFSGQG
jgi:hypothetical protein